MNGESFYFEGPNERVDVTSARGALNGHQKGRCFYCFDDIAVSDVIETNCDVDHFYPFVLRDKVPKINGVWNLVLACKPCNRGPGGKFAQVHSLKYVERLYRRNEFLMASNHPLKETLITQTGNTKELRAKFLKKVDKIAIEALIHRWEIEEVKEPTF